jgi:group II intron reverse transcriptase/maturase
MTDTTGNRMILMRATNKPFQIDKRLVYEAYKAVKSNRGAAGVDGQTIEQFEADLSGNLYKIWNRMSSGCYVPPPVRAVSIPKKSGGERILGVPTVADRVAQTVVKQVLEPILDSIFLADSYGYRPNKSALDAIGVTRERCWKYDWVLEFDIKGLFDNIDHDLLLRAVRKHVTCKWVLLYIERWLKAPMVQEDGATVQRSRGTPQGGVVSPILANLFMHSRSISGWDGLTRASRGVGMQTTDWYIAVTSRRRRRLSRRFKFAWRSAVWRCIRRKPKSFTAKTESGKASTRMSNLTFSGFASAHVWYRIFETRHCSGASIRQLVPRR